MRPCQVPAQWDASLITLDPIFKTNANYVKEFNLSAGYIPTHITASGSAAAMALYVTLKNSFFNVVHQYRCINGSIKAFNSNSGDS
jgi:hypothetical protein